MWTEENAIVDFLLMYFIACAAINIAFHVALQILNTLKVCELLKTKSECRHL